MLAFEIAKPYWAAMVLIVLGLLVAIYPRTSRDEAVHSDQMTVEGARFTAEVLFISIGILTALVAGFIENPPWEWGIGPYQWSGLGVVLIILIARFTNRPRWLGRLVNGGEYSNHARY